MKVVWRFAAIRDRRAAFDFLLERNPGAAVQVVQRLVLAADSLSTFPDRGRPGAKPGTRELVSVRPYVVLYRVAEDEVVILRVWHGAQSRED